MCSLPAYGCRQLVVSGFVYLFMLFFVAGYLAVNFGRLMVCLIKERRKLLQQFHK